MLLKQNVKINGLRPELLLAIVIVNDVYKHFDEELVITAITDGIHSKTSLHYVGFAFDCRIWYFDKNEIPQVVKMIKEALTDEFDVVLEKDHIHIEFQPKTPNHA